MKSDDRLLLSLKRIDPLRLSLFALVLFLISTPLYSWSLISVPGVGAVPLDMTGALLLCVVALFVIIGRKRLVFPSPVGLFLLFACFSLLSVIVNAPLEPLHVMGMATLQFQLVVIVGTSVAFSNFKLEPSHIALLVRTWLLIAVAVATFGVYQGIARVADLPFARLMFNYAGTLITQRVGYDYPDYLRVASTFAEPAWYGVFLVPAAVTAIVLYELSYKGSTVVFQARRTHLTVLVLLIAGVFQSASLLAILTLGTTIVAIILPILILKGNLHRSHVVSSIAVIGSGLIISETLRLLVAQFIRIPYNVLLAAYTGNVYEVATIGSSEKRLRTVLHVVDQWAALPTFFKLIGRGANSLARTNNEFTSATSGFFQILIDQGLIGIVLFSGTILLILRHLICIGFDEKQEPLSSKLAIALIAAVFAMAVSFLQIGYVRPSRWVPVYLAVALLTSVHE